MLLACQEIQRQSACRERMCLCRKSACNVRCRRSDRSSKGKKLSFFCILTSRTWDYSEICSAYRDLVFCLFS